MSDIEAAQAVIRRLDWMIALHLAVGHNTSFDPTTLVYFRRRLKDNGKMRLIFDKTIEIAKSLKLIKRRMNQRVDAVRAVSHVTRIATTDPMQPGPLKSWTIAFLRETVSSLLSSS